MHEWQERGLALGGHWRLGGEWVEEERALTVLFNSLGSLVLVPEVYLIRVVYCCMFFWCRHSVISGEFSSCHQSGRRTWRISKASILHSSHHPRLAFLELIHYLCGDLFISTFPTNHAIPSHMYILSVQYLADPVRRRRHGTFTPN